MQLVLLAINHGAHCQWENTIYIDSNKGQDSIGCLVTESTPCASVQYAVENGLQNSTQFVLLSHLNILNNTVVVSDVDSVSFIAGNLSHPTVVYCNIGNQSTGAGLLFSRISNLYFAGLSLENCGNILSSTTRDNDVMLMFRSAMYILNSTNVSVESTSFMRNPGIGLVLFDTNGHVTIQNSLFTENQVPLDETSTYAGGGGLYIEHTYCTPGRINCNYADNPYSNGSLYKISHCYFDHNHGSILPERGNTWVRFQKSSSNRLGRGAGIAITLKGESTLNEFQITNCTFVNNSAEFGGALNIQLQDYSTFNSIQVNDSQFVNNSAVDGGGGALFLGIFFYDCDCVFGNELVFNHVQYTGNTALYGGGIIFSSSRSKLPDFTNDVNFVQNTWAQNAASLGAAILLSQEAWNSHALSSGYLPIPVFEDCTFEENRIESNVSHQTSLTFQATEGVLFSSTYSVNFSSSVSFLNNRGTAISITAAFLNICPGTVANFTGNQGNRGGAVALLEFASLRTFPDSVLYFYNNYATSVGGALYASSSDDTDFYYSRSCFITYSDDDKPNPRDWSTNFYFSENQAGPCSISNKQVTDLPSCPEESGDQYGQSVYAISIRACDRATEVPGSNITSGYFFKQAPFHFLTGMHIATDPSIFMIGSDVLESNLLKVAPGELKNLSITARDDLNNSIQSAYTASVRITADRDVKVDSATRYVSANTVLLNGEIGAEFQLTLNSVGRRIISLSVNGTLTNCPPGLVYSDNAERCVCSATTAGKQYRGITKCSMEVFSGILDRGYWAGCYGDNNTVVLTAECPFGYCRYEDNREINNISLNDPARSTFFILPRTCEGVDEFLCGEQNREDILCGKCKENFSVFYHSQRFGCHKCQGNLGAVYYLLSEILPITILFVIIVAFNIHLTSGLWCSVILFGQIIDFFEVHSFDLTDRSQALTTLTNIYRFIYSSFNLDFFKYDDDLSFCLFERATAMDVLAFKYLTTLYTLVLLVILILSFRSSCWDRCVGFWKKFENIFSSGNPEHRSWVIHGIAAFLVLSYAQCAKTSFQILSYIELEREGFEPVKKVVLLSGHMDYFGSQHLIYAIFAVVVILLVTLLPVILLVYPTHYRVLRCCLGEQKFEACTSHSLIHLSKFKPLFDSFQGCYRDNFRFFAGLFFLYRFVIAACYAFSTNATMLYVLLEIFIILMLSIHTVLQPYENKFFNIIDSVMFTNLAIVNALNLFSGNLHVAAQWIQLLLIYLPLLYIVLMTIAVIVTKFSKRARHHLVKVNTVIPLFEMSSEVSDTHNHERSPSASEDDEMPYRIYEEDRQRDLERTQIAKAAAEEHRKHMYHSFENSANPGAPKQVPNRGDTY